MRGGGRAIARVWSALPARAAIEWSEDPAFTSPQIGTAADLAEPPYTHAETLRLEPGRPLYWRAALRSATTGAVTRTEPHRVEAHAGDRPLVLLAASCAQFTGAPENAGYDRLLEAAPAAPAALVYQGDIGYPNNARDACYAAAPDFFADRFGRLLESARVRPLPPQRPGRLHDGRSRLRAGQQRRPHHRRAVDVGALEPHPRRPGAARVLRLPRRRRALPDARRAPLLRSGDDPELPREDEARARAVRVDGRHPAVERRGDVRRLLGRHLRHPRRICARTSGWTTASSSAGRTSTGGRWRSSWTSSSAAAACS